MPSPTATAEAPPTAQRDLAEGGQEQQPQDAQPAIALEETLAGPAEPIPPSDTPHDASPVETAREPPIKPQGVTDEAWRKLNSKQKGFVAAYVQDGNALNAYLSAGYVQNRNGHPKEWIQRRAYQVRKGKAVVKALLEYQEQRAALAEAKKDFALDWIVSEHERLKELAERRGELAVATRNLELIGRTRGAYADVALIDPTWRREYSETERQEAARLSRLALKDGMGGPAALPPGESEGQSRSDNVPVCCAPDAVPAPETQVEPPAEGRPQGVGVGVGGE